MLCAEWKCIVIGDPHGYTLGVRSQTCTRGAGTGLLAGINKTDPGYYPWVTMKTSI